MRTGGSGKQGTEDAMVAAARDEKRTDLRIDSGYGKVVAVSKVQRKKVERIPVIAPLPPICQGGAEISKQNIC